MRSQLRTTTDGARILVVDDDAARRERVLSMMRDAGHDALSAPGTQEAFELARHVRPELVLFGAGITGLDPYELCRRLRSEPTLDDAFLVQMGEDAVSAADRVRGTGEGVDAFLARALPRRELIARVEAMVRVQRAESALRRLKRRQATRTEVTRILSTAHSIDEAAPRLLRALAEGGGWAVGELWMAAPDAERLTRRASWSDGAEAFVGEPAAPSAARGEDLPGEVWARGELAWVADVSAHPGFARAEGAARAGLRGAAALPIARSRGVEAVLLLLAREAAPADHDLLLMLDDIAAQIGQFLDRVEAESEVRFGRSLFEAVIESIPDGVTLKDLDGRYLMVNGPIERLFGRPASEIVGRSDVELVPQELHEPMRRQEEEAVRLGVSSSAEYMVGSGGEKRAFLVLKSVCRDADGRILGTIGVSRDVTEHRHAEERMRLAQRVEALGRLAGGVAHDFNNLLTVITVNSDLALQSLEPEHPLSRAFVEIRDAAERASDLTRQLLAYGRRQHLHPRTLDLNTVLSNLNSLLRRLIPENIVIGVMPGSGLHPVTVDPTQIEQVVLNLAVNARDAMPHGGHLDIETRNVTVAAGEHPHCPPMPPGDYVQLTVSDDGMGMDDETRTRIFEPFFTTKAMGHGTGLGLAMVYGTVKQSGGWIWVESAPDAGSAFTLLLPRATASPQALGGSYDPSPVPRGTETVLLVEDDAVVRDISRRVLEGCGYRVLVARDGRHAIELASQPDVPIALMVTDVVMPHMSGPDLSERLATLRPGLRVVYVSGYADQAVLPAAVLEGGIPFLQKPFTPESLARKVRAALDSK